MPTYEFVCRNCGRVMEVKETLAEKEKNPERTCPDCQSKDVVQYFGNAIVIPSTHLH